MGAAIVSSMTRGPQVAGAGSFFTTLAAGRWRYIFLVETTGS